MALPKTKDLATGKWREILIKLGIDNKYLTGKHGPCPICEAGKDRFRWDNKNGTGSYYCNQCGPGRSGMTLLMKSYGWDYATAAKEVDNIVEGCKAMQNKPEIDIEETRRWLNQIWSEGEYDSNIVIDYLRGRGLSFIPKCLKGHRGLKYRHKNVIGRYPAMMAKISNVDGIPVCIHRTFMGDNLPKRKMNTPDVASISGCAIRLFPIYDTIALTEGIEDAISVYELYDKPCWATISANGMCSVVLPDSIKRVLIFGDNDKCFAGQSAAYKLANRLVLEGRKVSVHIPKDAGKDWNDILREKNA